MRALFFNEGNLGAHIMGQGQLETALRIGLAELPEVDARFVGLGSMGRIAQAAAYRTLGPITGAGLDPRALRWHIVQSLRARHAVSTELRNRPADVVHIHTQSVALLMGSAMHTTPVALSVDTTVRDWWSMPAWRPQQSYAGALIAPSVALERRALERAALVLAWTPWAQHAIERSAPGARTVEHHPGLDLTRHRPAQRQARQRPRVLFVGGRFVEKGGEDLLAALGDSLGRDVELDIVTPAAVTEREGVRVHRLSPSSPELIDLQQQSDIVCLPTRGDAAPWAVLEAMACGTPVIATSVGGIPDLLERGRSGVLIPCGDRRALANALSALLADPQRRAALAGRARSRCEAQYDVRHQIPRLVDHLSAATDERSRR